MDAAGTLYRQKFAIGRDTFAWLAATAEIATITAVSVLAGMLHHLIAYEELGEPSRLLAVGLLAAWVFALPFLSRNEYRVQAILDDLRSPRRLFFVWNYTFLSLAVIGFLTKSSAEFSRGWIILFYIFGLASVLTLNVLIKWALTSLIEAGRIERRRIMLVGVDADVRPAERQLSASASGAEVSAMVSIEPCVREDGTPGFKECDLDKAVSWARSLQIQDVVVVADWARGSTIEPVVNALSVLPAAIHVDIDGLTNRLAPVRISHVGETSVLSIKEEPLDPGQALIKRTFDIVAASLALLLLAPVFAAIAVAIRFESKGPAFFLQRRRGYNQQVFQIWKFRTMTTMDDGDVIVQARRNDTRLTRIGRFLRRYNIDELPQLVNVLRGEMSLVGPRPHAVAHDRLYEKSLLHYPRRLNVRPGITGWAQVNGHRGQTETDAAMAKRLEYDLQYIDNWSLGFDLYIVMMTVLSPRAYRNAH